MSFLTRQMLINWAGPRKFAEGLSLFEKGMVEEVSSEPPVVQGVITYGTRTMKSGFRMLPDGSAESLCPCYDNRERGIICSHVIAVGLALIRHLNDPEAVARRQAEERRAARQQAFDENAYLKRAPLHVAGTVTAAIGLTLEDGWEAAPASGRIPLRAWAEYDGQRRPLEAVPRHVTLGLTEQDANLLYVLEDVANGPVAGPLAVSPADLSNLLSLHAGWRPLRRGPGGETAVPVLTDRRGTRLHIALDRQTGELSVGIRTPGPDGSPLAGAVYVTDRKRGWVYDGTAFQPLDTLLPAPLQGIYQSPMTIPRRSVPRFLQNEWPVLAKLLPVDSELSPDLFTIDPARPRFRFVVRGSPASLSGTLCADYGETVLVAGKSDAASHFAIPDPGDLMRYLVRNPDAESAALRHVSRLGFHGEKGDELSPVIGCREVMNFLAKDVPALHRLGWKVEVQGRAGDFLETATYLTPVIHITGGNGNGWFDIQYRFEDTQGRSLTHGEIQRAILKGDSFIEKNGQTILFDAGAIHAMREVFEDCSTSEGAEPGSFRLSNIYAAYVKSSLDALEGVDVEAEPGWRQAAARLQTHEDAPVAVEDLPPAAGVLRDYQKRGVRWLRFLEQGGFAGILADEMGLGKTLQTLVWLSQQRLHPQARGRPALIVCPTSLVENWAAEAARFTPDLRIHVVSGLERHDRWSEIPHADLVVTSYALLRRDVDRYGDVEFSVVVLDEAQHIKNYSTQNAIAAKRLRAFHRLVLTGTPMENSVADLWSIMDFLMPGYLGNRESFRRHIELPIAQNGAEGEIAQAKIRRKLHPFLLRRVKRDVAKELPPKISRVAYCSLTADQQAVYREILDQSRRRISDLVREKGVAASRMEVLKTLLRLRQICCHLGLLRMADLKSEYPSAKMDLLFELLDEAIDGGHRVLLFSQFVSMLHLVRDELGRRGWSHCYLDGSTQDRLSVVREFNTNRRIPIFLISLKAGGTGLNLTGADMVIHYDPWWNPAVEDQATDRAYRIGQNRTVYSVKLIARGTVEEKVMEMQKRKQALIDATVRADESFASRLDWNDIRELLDL